MSNPSGLVPPDFHPTERIRAERVIAAINAAYSTTQAVADRPGLVALDPATLKSGSLAWCLLTREWYVCLTTHGGTADGFDIVAGATGPQNPLAAGYAVNPTAGASLARFVKLDVDASFDPEASINLATDVYIDPVAGNDQGPGTLLAPLKTPQEAHRRWVAAGSSHLTAQTLHLASVLPDTSPLILDSFVPGGLIVAGAFGAAAVTTPITAVTAIDRTAVGNHPLYIDVATAALADWTPHVKHVVRISVSVAPGNVGAVAYVVSDEGPVGPDQRAVMTPFVDAGGNIVAALVGDTLQIDPVQVTVPDTSLFQRAVRGAEVATQLLYVDVAPAAASPEEALYTGAFGAKSVVKMIGCRISGTVPVDGGATLQLAGCSIDGEVDVFDGLCQHIATAVNDGVVQASKGSAGVEFDNDSIVHTPAPARGVIVSSGASSALNAVCAWRCTGAPPFSWEQRGLITSGGMAFYGQNNTQDLWLLGDFTTGALPAASGLTGCVATTTTNEIATTAGTTSSFAAAQAAGGFADVAVSLITGIPDPTKTQSLLNFLL